MTDPIPEGMFLYHYNRDPDPLDHPINKLQAGDRVYAVYPVDPDTVKVGDRVSVIPMVVGTPPAPVPPTRRARLWCWLTRRETPVTGEFRIKFGVPGAGADRPVA